ncbi:MAG TPA: glycosyltransferase family A protein [Gemmataceae bacterium]|nr:glycosyltransferase family A protein [Gemmataceae bacterium]
MPFFSCILLSHDKAAHVGEAIDSLLAQTFRDWEAVVMDSGVLHDRGFFSSLPAMKDPRIRLVRSWETEETRKTKTIASWCFNECFRKKLLGGQYVTYLCDDDLFYPNAFQAFHDYAQAHPDAKAMYASVDMTGVSADGEKLSFRELLAEEVKGSCCGGGPLDCHVDYLQLCHKADLFDLFPEGDFWPEDREVIQHADGIFLEKIGNLVPIYPIPVKIGENRKVPLSLNTGGERLELLLEVCRREHEIKRLGKLLAEMGQELAVLRSRREDCLRYRVVDKLNGTLQRVPALHWLGKKLLLTSWQVWRRALRQTA